MDQSFINRMEEALLARKQEILNSHVQRTADFKVIAEDMEAKDLVDAASDDIDKKMIEMLGSKEQNELDRIDNAIVRIKTGKYGKCAKCGGPIEEGRLEAVPSAIKCIKCQQADEKQAR